jgi:hypothetical protein
MLNVIMLNVAKLSLAAELNIVMLNVVMLSVVVPFKTVKTDQTAYKIYFETTNRQCLDNSAINSKKKTL